MNTAHKCIDEKNNKQFYTKNLKCIHGRILIVYLCVSTYLELPRIFQNNNNNDVVIGSNAQTTLIFIS